MRDAGHRTPDAGHRTSDIGQRTSDIGHRTAKKAKIIYPPPRGVDIIPGRSEFGSSSQPAVHSNQFPGHPLPLLPTQRPGPQGWD